MQFLKLQLNLTPQNPKPLLESLLFKAVRLQVDGYSPCCSRDGERNPRFPIGPSRIRGIHGLKGLGFRVSFFPTSRF